MKVASFSIALLFVVAASSSVDDLSFSVVGDWGGQGTWPYTTRAETNVAKQMGIVAGKINAHFTVALGDNFYYAGVTDVHDKRFKETFEDVFTASSLQHNWYVIAGNHDHYGNVSAEVEYTKLSSRWYMPSLYYSQTFTIPGSSASVEFVFIDTIVLAGLTHPIHRGIPPPGPSSVQAAEDEWTWIETTLSQSTADWLFVLGHYPVWSIGEHGPTQQLVDRLRPMLIKYEATAYFCGHDHSMQHIREENSTLDYFVIGAGHMSDHSEAHKDSIPKGSLKYWNAPLDPTYSHGSFGTVTMTTKQFNVTYYDYKGRMLYTTLNTHPRSSGRSGKDY